MLPLSERDVGVPGPIVRESPKVQSGARPPEAVWRRCARVMAGMREISSQEGLSWHVLI